MVDGLEFRIPDPLEASNWSRAVERTVQVKGLHKEGTFTRDLRGYVG